MSVFCEPHLPAVSDLLAEQIVISDIANAPDGALKVGVLNLMPLKIPTEKDILRAFSETPTDITFRFFTTASHKSRNTSQEHIDRFYGFITEETIGEIDALIITGAPVELIDYENVDYYPEFCGILDMAERRRMPVLLLCWAAFAGLYRRYGLDRTILTKKISGVYPHRVAEPNHPLMTGIGDIIYAPQSRFVTIEAERAKSKPGLDIIAFSEKTGVHISATPDRMETFITGHGEYAVETLANEYERDTKRGMNPSIPENYFEDNCPGHRIMNLWQGTGRKIFNNWVQRIAYPQKLSKGNRSAEQAQ